jgi:ATP-binding cassette, subfamily B, bacterial PglK
VSVFSSIKKLWGTLTKRRRIQFFLLTLLMILGSFLEVVSIGIVIPFLGILVAPEKIFQNETLQPLFQLLGFSNPSELLFPITIVFCLAVLFSNAMRLTLLWLGTRISLASGAELSVGIYRRILYQPYSFHCSRNSSEMISGTSSKSNLVVYSIILPSLVMLNSSIVMIAIIGALIIIDALVTFLLFGILVFIYSIIVFVKRKQLSKESEVISSETTNIIKALQEGLGGIRDVIIDGSQEIYTKIYRNSDYALRRAQGNNIIIAGSPRFLLESLGMIAIAIFAYVLVQGPGGITSTIPILGAVALGAQRLLPMIQNTYSSWVAIKGHHTSLIDILELLEKKLPYHADKPSTLTLAFNHNISIKQMFFRYSQDTPDILKRINLNIKKGSRVGFIGPTGSGKSTLIDVIMGLLEPSNGTIEIDGVPLTIENNRGWHTHIAHVPQHIYLSDASIEENIAFGIEKKNIDSERVQLAADQAQIATTIESWPKKYQTYVGERGVKLSGGQQQRIGIARALYKKADVIILDEATSALDDTTENEVMESINNLSKDTTVLIIAHRLTTLKNCTHIVKLDNGNIDKILTYKDIER